MPRENRHTSVDSHSLPDRTNRVTKSLAYNWCVVASTRYVDFSRLVPSLTSYMVQIGASPRRYMDTVTALDLCLAGIPEQEEETAINSHVPFHRCRMVGLLLKLELTLCFGAGRSMLIPLFILVNSALHPAGDDVAEDASLEADVSPTVLGGVDVPAMIAAAAAADLLLGGVPLPRLIDGR